MKIENKISTYYLCECEGESERVCPRLFVRKGGLHMPRIEIELIIRKAGQIILNILAKL